MSGTFSFLFLISLMTLIKDGFSLSVDCTYSSNDIRYDVSPLLSRDYKDKFAYYGDSASASTTLYWYNIICGNITTTPNVSSCSNNTIRPTLSTPLPPGYCLTNSIENHTCSNYTTINGPVAAYQIENDLCYRLHDGITAPTINLVNESDPLSGIHIKYINGDFCEKNNTNRESNIYVLCNKTNVNSSYHAFESPLCTYVLQISSVFGCPSACINYQTNEVCTNHGNCLRNNDDMECSCDEGWSGNLCNVTASISPNATSLSPNATFGSPNATLPTTGNHGKKNKNHNWPRWLGILLAVLAALFLCCCIASLLACLYATKKLKNSSSNPSRRAKPTPVTRNEYVPTNQNENV